MKEMASVSRGGEPTPQTALGEEAAGKRAKGGARNEASLCTHTASWETPRGCQRQISKHAWNSICAGPGVSSAVNDTPQEPP